MKYDINGKLYNPIIVKSVYNIFLTGYIIVTDSSCNITNGDVLVAPDLNAKFHINTVENIVDFFENYILLQATPLMVSTHVLSDIIKPGDELKLLASAYEKA